MTTTIFCSLACNRAYHDTVVAYPGDGHETECQNCGAPISPNGGDTAFGVRKGTRVRLISSTDPFPIEPGSEGTVTGWNTDARFAQVWVNWDGPRSLNLIPGEDRWEIIQ